MNISEWFDIYHMDHLRAYKDLMDEGMWPVYFWDIMREQGIKMDEGWQYKLMAKMTKAYINMKIGDELIKKL